jgi:hypothetical protein
VGVYFDSGFPAVSEAFVMESRWFYFLGPVIDFVWGQCVRVSGRCQSAND